MIAYLVSTSPWLLDVDEHDGDGGAVLITEDLSTIVPILQNLETKSKQKTNFNSALSSSLCLYNFNFN